MTGLTSWVPQKLLGYFSWVHVQMKPVNLDLWTQHCEAPARRRRRFAATAAEFHWKPCSCFLAKQSLLCRVFMERGESSQGGGLCADVFRCEVLRLGHRVEVDFLKGLDRGTIKPDWAVHWLLLFPSCDVVWSSVLNTSLTCRHRFVQLKPSDCKNRLTPKYVERGALCTTNHALAQVDHGLVQSMCVPCAARGRMSMDGWIHCQAEWTVDFRPTVACTGICSTLFQVSFIVWNRSQHDSAMVFGQKEKCSLGTSK